MHKARGLKDLCNSTQGPGTEKKFKSDKCKTFSTVSNIGFETPGINCVCSKQYTYSYRAFYFSIPLCLLLRHTFQFFYFLAVVSV